MPAFLQHTTNPTFVEVGVEFFLPTDSTSWIPNGFDMVDDRYATLEEVAEKFCKHIGVVFSQVIESDLW